MKVDVLVPNTFVWWTVLALAADQDDRFEQVHFVDQFTYLSEVIAVHSSVLGEVVDLVPRGAKVIVLLWDGHRSYEAARNAIGDLRKRAGDIELRVVGDLWSDEDGFSKHTCKRLFNQSSHAYDRRRLLSEVCSRFVFRTPIQKLTVLWRSQLISLRVLLQLLAKHRFAEYRKTSFVFCGQSGLDTLRQLSIEFGIDPAKCEHSSGGLECDRGFLLMWIHAITFKRECRTSLVAARSLVRLIALRKLRECLADRIFMNIYPEPNINAYQAESLFQRHVFFEFGGINGSEAVYPRMADILFLGRRLLRFDTESAVRELLDLNGVDPDAPSRFIELFEEAVICKLQAHGVNVPCTAGAFDQPS